MDWQATAKRKQNGKEPPEVAVRWNVIEMNAMFHIEMMITAVLVGKMHGIIANW